MRKLFFSGLALAASAFVATVVTTNDHNNNWIAAVLHLKDSVKKDTNVYASFKDLPLKPERTISFNTQEGTWISVDVSPDGNTIAFDLMGDIYTMPITGGKATPVTKGFAYETHPRFSPDGNKLLFTSDRSGGDNLWVIDHVKQDTLQLTKTRVDDYVNAVWTPDGKYVIARSGRPIPR